MHRADLKLITVHFDNPRLASVGIEVLTLAELKRRAPRSLLSTTQRVDFLHIIIVQSGNASHMVDFADHPLAPGSMVVVRPGQVHRWEYEADISGLVILVSSQALRPWITRAETDPNFLAVEDLPTSAPLGADSMRHIVDETLRLQRQIDEFSGCPIDASIIRHTFTILLLRLTRDFRVHVGAATSAEAKIFRMFSRELELHFMQNWRVRDFAKRIGYSETTLSRACLAATGKTAKEVLDQRVLLEAKRLLSHTELAVSSIGRQLGFAEPSNFVKFFKRMAELTPREFREYTRAQER